MKVAATPSRPPELRLERPARAPESRAPEAEAALLAAVARVLHEVRANGIDLPRRGDRLSVAHLQALRANLARAGWEQGRLPGESPTRPLHTEHNGWGPPLEAPSERPGRAAGVPWLVLALDALGFLSGAMGPEDVLVWRERAP